MPKVKKGDHVWILENGTPVQAQIERVKKGNLLLRYVARVTSGYVNRLDWFPPDSCWTWPGQNDNKPNGK